MPEIENIKLPFAEAIEFFLGKLGNLIPTARWDDVMRAQHDRGFMVAGAAKADLLADFASAVEESIAEGKSIEYFRSAFDAIVDAHGWAYEGERNWRTRVIYQTNMNTAYAAGRLAQLRDPDLQLLKPLVMYKHNDSVTTPRPEHEAWDGITLPIDDPWWSTHYPPNDWGCLCYPVAVSQEEAQAQGGRFDAPPDVIDPATGEPQGIGRGWGYAPGDTVTDDVRARVTEKAAALPAPLGDALRKDLDTRNEE